MGPSPKSVQVPIPPGRFQPVHGPLRLRTWKKGVVHYPQFGGGKTDKIIGFLKQPGGASERVDGSLHDCQVKNLKALAKVLNLMGQGKREVLPRVKMVMQAPR